MEIDDVGEKKYMYHLFSHLFNFVDFYTILHQLFMALYSVSPLLFYVAEVKDNYVKSLIPSDFTNGSI